MEFLSPKKNQGLFDCAEGEERFICKKGIFLDICLNFESFLLDFLRVGKNYFLLDCVTLKQGQIWKKVDNLRKCFL